MLHYTDTTVFNVNVQTIVNTVNCVGVMGAGLALECKLRFPEMYDDYESKCKQKQLKVGRPYVYRGYNCPWIMNFPTKNDWKYPSKIQWIEEGLQYFVEKYQTGGITSIAFPKLGCDRGGLDWNDVKLIMEKYLEPLDIEVYICLDKTYEAMGIEKQMIDYINDSQHPIWASELGIRDDIASKILNSVPLRRFREILKIKGVGKQTYCDLFQYLYSQSLLSQAQSLESLNHSNQKEDQLVDIEQSTIELEEQQTTQNETKISNNGKESKFIDAFDVIWPYLEKQLQSEKTDTELAEYFNVKSVQMKDWLKKSVEIGKVKKLRKPVRYILDDLPLLEKLESK